MLKRELKKALTVVGATLLPLSMQADQVQPQQEPLLLGESVKVGQLPAGYNQSAAYSCNNGWDVFLTGDYIWWNWSQGSLTMKVPTLGASTSAFNTSISPTLISPGYASGFQVGLGFNMRGMDDWNFYGEYTWYKNSGSNTLNNSFSGLADLSGRADLYGEESIAYNNADFLLQRSFYLGRKLTTSYFAGLKALWINSEGSRSGSASVSSTMDFVNNVNLTSINNTQNLSSWSLGPKFGFDANWLLGYGFKFISNISASLVYVSFTGNSTTSVEGTATNLNSETVSLNGTVTTDITNYPSLRPIIETYLGLGWGTYFCDNGCHFDLSLGYDFNAYSTNKSVVSGSSGSIFLHGLNAQIRFDF